jgi:hypothetical protein
VIIDNTIVFSSYLFLKSLPGAGKLFVTIAIGIGFITSQILSKNLTALLQSTLSLIL